MHAGAAAGAQRLSLGELGPTVEEEVVGTYCRELGTFAEGVKGMTGARAFFNDIAERCQCSVSSKRCASLPPWCISLPTESYGAPGGSRKRPRED